MRIHGWHAAVLVLAAATLARTPASAADLDVRVGDARGNPLADAVVTIDGVGAPALDRAPATHVIDQSGLVFLPYLEVLRPGDRVVFHNSDRTQHHVYSFSPAKSFEFVLKPGESSPPLTFDRAGVVSAGCNNHDAMITYLFVTAAPWAARTSDTGRVRITGVPDGAWTVRVWHPLLRAGRKSPARQVVIAGKAPAPLAFRLELRPDPRRRADPERVGY